MHCIRLPRRSTAAFVTVALLALYLWVDVAQKLLYGDGRPSAKALLAKYYKCWYQSESSVPVDTSDANNCLYGLRVAAASDEVAQRATPSLRYFFPGPLHADSDPCQNGTERCVVAFGIYGNDSFYLEGGYRNVLQAKQYWPGWKLRFYTDHTLPKSYVQQLTTATSEVVVVDGVSRGPISGMFWRFFVMNDPTVDRFIVRDIDSNPGSRERAAMDEWVLSGRQWHLFRDHPDHTHWPIIGCCFGAVNKHTRAYTLLPGQLQQNGTLLYDDVEVWAFLSCAGSVNRPAIVALCTGTNTQWSSRSYDAIQRR
jgi:hypothetical protein